MSADGLLHNPNSLAGGGGGWYHVKQPEWRLLKLSRGEKAATPVWQCALPLIYTLQHTQINILINLGPGHTGGITPRDHPPGSGVGFL
eukprot:428897-Pelagomonas_calceolata.AAC.1